MPQQSADLQAAARDAAHWRADAVARGRRPAWRPLLGLLAAVLAVHLTLAGWLAPSRRPVGLAAAPAAGRLVLLRPALPPAARRDELAEPPPAWDDSAATAAGRTRPSSPTALPRPGVAPPQPALSVDAPGPARSPARSPVPGPVPSPVPSPVAARPVAADRLAVDVSANAAAAAVDAAAATPATTEAADERANEAATDAGSDDAAGTPPPVYPTRLPAAARWTYALRVNGQTGSAQIAWLPADGAYRLTLDGHSAAGAPLIEQASQGALDQHGLAPERFVDRRRGRGAQAAHFQRTPGLISFSGPQRRFTLWPGAQDRLSWLPQLAAIVAAASASQQEVRLFVADARGHAGLWRFTAQGPALVDTALGPLATQLWLREPPRPEGLRAEAWLDPARGHWPVRLRLTALRSGDVLELQLLGAPAPP